MRYEYDPMKGARRIPAPPMPAWGERIAARLEATVGRVPTERAANRYRTGQYLEMDRDDETYGPAIATGTLRGSWPMRFRPRSRDASEDGRSDDQIVLLPEHPILVLRGAARVAPWNPPTQHARAVGPDLRDVPQPLTPDTTPPSLHGIQRRDMLRGGPPRRAATL